jgi:chorismate mutase
MSTPTLRALRGATTCGADSVEEVTSATQELLLEILGRNDVAHDDVVSVIFTTTPDLRSTFPATAARGIGFGDVPLLCATEIDVPGAKPRCIRVLMHAYSARERTALVHVYLRDAQSLRDDLPG